MSKRTANSLFIDSSTPRLYQHLLAGIEGYQELGSRIIKKIEAAHAFRQTEQVKELARILINIPIRECKLIAEYYLAWCKSRESHYDAEALERVIEQTRTYKTKALFSRGAIEWFRGRPEAALCFYGEARKTTRSISEYIDLSRSMAVLKATEGFHNSALKDLEDLLPIIKHGEPLTYYETLNSYAVELIEAGRSDEARKVSRVVLASPLAFAYPEWQETANELKAVSRSSIAINPSSYVPRNVLPMPVIEHVKSERVEYNRPARVLNLLQWKKKMGKDDRKDMEPKTKREMMLRIMDLISEDDLSEHDLEMILRSAEKVIAGSKKKDKD